MHKLLLLDKCFVICSTDVLLCVLLHFVLQINGYFRTCREACLCSCLEYSVIDNCKLLTTFQSVMLNSNQPMKVAHFQKLANKPICN